MITGRFAPSPSGPLHLGSLVAAVGSWLYARAAGGRWLIRIEDLDAPRVVPGADADILAALRRYGLDWDGEVVWQSKRAELYDRALEELGAKGMMYDCGCSRADLQRAPSAPVGEEAIYPRTCRSGLAAGREARAIRFRAPDEKIAFHDLLHGSMELPVDDFIVKRADGLYAYQLAVVVDDGEQGVTQVVRGGDLLSSTARQIALQRALGLPTPRYAHLPVVIGIDGRKLGKRDGALPLPTAGEDQIRATLGAALRLLEIEVELAPTSAMLSSALSRFDAICLTGRTTVVHNPQKF